ncbi:hypothetical protein [Nitrospira lenta]|nr:hypothetical protein [Nitrospira lenta]
MNKKISFSIWYFFIRRLGQAQGGFMQVGQSKAKIYAETDIKVTFADRIALGHPGTVCENRCGVFLTSWRSRVHLSSR